MDNIGVTFFYRRYPNGQYQRYVSLSPEPQQTTSAHCLLSLISQRDCLSHSPGLPLSQRDTGCGAVEPLRLFPPTFFPLIFLSRFVYVTPLLQPHFLNPHPNSTDSENSQGMAASSFQRLRSRGAVQPRSSRRPRLPSSVQRRMMACLSCE